MTNISPFLHPGAVAEKDKISVIYLRKDQQLPTVLKDRDDANEGYSEGKVVNTRFGSFPHTTMINLPWGTQVRASKVDTGSRGRRKEKRKQPDDEAEASTPAANGDAPKEATTASSGFVHILPPTPENWTSSLPHRTQVVYTPDYSYVLHRIRARPGSTLIEAGAGSGSFTHASSRAVYSGYPSHEPLAKKRKLGKVYSYEFHEQRYGKLVEELHEHGLDGVVQITHRDVCGEGFLVGEEKNQSPGADAIFLDLPAPWLALPHLARKPVPGNEPKDGKPFVTALNPKAPVHICSFSPCIEQVQRTMSTMRQLGWVQIEMVEVQHKRLEVRRERVGIVHGQNQHGVLNTPATVQEAVDRLKEIEGRFKTFHGSEPSTGEEKTQRKRDKQQQPNNKAAILSSLVDKKVYKEGTLIHKTEPEVKTHTSYLVFAVLPMEWSEEEEARATAKWPVKNTISDRPGQNQGGKRVSNRELKRAAKEEKKKAEEERLVPAPGAVDIVEEGVEVAGEEAA